MPDRLQEIRARLDPAGTRNQIAETKAEFMGAATRQDAMRALKGVSPTMWPWCWWAHVAQLPKDAKVSVAQPLCDGGEDA